MMLGKRKMLQEEEKFDLEISDSSSGLDDEGDEEGGDYNNDEEDKDSENLEEKIRQQLMHRYEVNKGKKLYIRFPAKLPEDDEKLNEQAQNLSDLIIEVHRPRQRHARFCLVDFATNEDRQQALKSIRASIKKGEDEIFKKLVVSIPRTESAEFVEELVQKKLKTIESRKAKRRLKRASVVANRTKNFTSTLILKNLPQAASAIELRSLFPNAIDVQTRREKAAITFPTPLDASKAFKNPPKLYNEQLKLQYAVTKPQKKSQQKKTDEAKATKVITEEGEKNADEAPPTVVKKNNKKRKAQSALKIEEKTPVVEKAMKTIKQKKTKI